MKYDNQIIADIREATDLDGAMIEKRTVDLVKGGTISPTLALEILKESHSDLVTPELIEAVGQDNAIGRIVKEKQDAGSTGV